MSLNGLRHGFLIALLGFAGVATVQAQSAVEYGSLTSKAAVAASRAKLPDLKLTLPTPASGARSPHLPAPSGEPDAATNRLALQQRAGPDAAEILLRSVPDHAQVWIDALFVGTTPLELKLAPGHHRVLMRASDMKDGHEEVELVGKQTRQVVLSLKSRYSNKVYLNWPSRD